MQPLTQQGIYQAKLANRAIGNFPFWRFYASDLKRCQTTAAIILGLDALDEDDKIISSCDVRHGSKNNGVLILDERLRERAKGVREGQDKGLSYDDAFEIFRREKYEAGERGEDESSWTIPLLETEDEVFDRVNDWFEEIVHDAYEHYLENDGENSKYDIFAVTHSGTLRIIIERMVGDQLPKDVKREATDKDGIQVGRLKVPNTSITRIEITPHVDDKSTDKQQYLDIDVKKSGGGGETILWKAKLLDLTSTLHLEAENEVE